MLLALPDVRVQIIERLHVNRSKRGDLGETRDFGVRQSNVVAEADHRRSCQCAITLTIVALFYLLVSTSLHCFFSKILSPVSSVTPQRHCADIFSRRTRNVRQFHNSSLLHTIDHLTESTPHRRINIDRAAALGPQVDPHAMLRQPFIAISSSNKFLLLNAWLVACACLLKLENVDQVPVAPTHPFANGLAGRHFLASGH